MELLTRYQKNPILQPDDNLLWEKDGAFNGCPVVNGSLVNLLYRAVSAEQDYNGVKIKLSTIGRAVSKNGLDFKRVGQSIVPEYDWERFGCEDPRVSHYRGMNYVFYTALSGYPFNAGNIRVGLAMTKDFKKFVKKPITHFNSKAMALFPEAVKGKMTAILTINTDNPPAKIAIVQFNKHDDLWSREFWDKWYDNRHEHYVPLQRSPYDHVEVGAPPIRTKHGWLLIYSYIKNYFQPPVTFGIEAVLLDLDDPRKVIARSPEPLLTPGADYELTGQVANIAFPSGALVNKGNLYLYYGAADTSCCVAVGKLNDVLDSLLPVEKIERYKKNPILKPDPEIAWRSKAVLNPAALLIKDKVHLVYRAMSQHDTSRLGHAVSKDGLSLAEVDVEPAYVPRIQLEEKLSNGNSGCEDPRLTLMGKTVYMCYTAYNGRELPHVGFSSIALDDFLKKKWKWQNPEIISPAGFDDKDAALFPEKIEGHYAFLHRLNQSIWLDLKPSLENLAASRLKGKILLSPRPGMWDDDKIGLASPPLYTEAGWLILYHGICKKDLQYRVGAAILSKLHPSIVIARSIEPILEPQMPYETNGLVNNVVFPCGAVIHKDKLLIYYGGGDSVLCSGSLNLKRLLRSLKHTQP